MSAAGLLAARPVVELVQALPTGTSEAQTAVLDDGFATLATAAAAALGRLGADAALAQEERRCEVHAEGHGTSLTLALPDGHAPAAIHAAFRAAHHRLFGLEVAPGRLVVTALRLRAAVSEAPLPPAPLDAARMAPAIRPAWFEDAGWQETAVLDRAALGAARRGPCIIAESGCTVLVPAGWTIEALASGGLAMAS